MGCSGDREPAASNAPASPASPPAAGAADSGKQYYDTLVAQFGEDYAACGAGETAIHAGCESQASTAGARGGPTNVLLMLDSSGSMAARIGGDRKLTIAQDALLDFARKLPSTARVALRVYGHTGSNEAAGKPASCRGTELRYPFSPPDAAGFETAVRSFEPVGWTPIAASLDAAAADFATAPKGARNVIYLVSDGIETCDADPVEAARRLQASGVKVVTNVIGFDVDGPANQQLKAVAAAGGGEYLTATSRQDLQRLFNERFIDALRQHNCEAIGSLQAKNRTGISQLQRKNCLTTRALKEKNRINIQALQDANAGQITAATREYVKQQSEAKYASIVTPAQAQYETTTSASDARYEEQSRRSREEYERSTNRIEQDRTKSD